MSFDEWFERLFELPVWAQPDWKLREELLPPAARDWSRIWDWNDRSVRGRHLHGIETPKVYPHSWDLWRVPWWRLTDHWRWLHSAPWDPCPWTKGSKRRRFYVPGHHTSFDGCPGCQGCTGEDHRCHVFGVGGYCTLPDHEQKYGPPSYWWPDDPMKGSA